MALMRFISAERRLACGQKPRILPWKRWQRASRFAHEHGVKVYVTANILAHNRDLDGVGSIFSGIERDWTGCADHFGPGRVYHCRKGMSGD